jgi:hypothetical protein
MYRAECGVGEEKTHTLYCISYGIWYMVYDERTQKREKTRREEKMKAQKRAKGMPQINQSTITK